MMLLAACMGLFQIMSIWLLPYGVCLSDSETYGK